MTYPQPGQASTEIIEGSEFFRLYTELESGGDIYEVDASASAFVIGPQSDLARLRITYFDPSAPNQVSSFVVSVDDPFIGRIDALGTQKYPVAKTTAKILVSPEDLYDRIALDSANVQPPRIDLLAYLAPPPNVPSKRADFYMEGRFTVVDNGGGTGVTDMDLPFYRRKYGNILLKNFTAGSTYNYIIQGIAFTTDKNGSVYQTFRKNLLTGSVAAGALAVLEVKASTHGFWDYLQIHIDGPAVDSAATQLCPKYRVTFADEEV